MPALPPEDELDSVPKKNVGRGNSKFTVEM